MSDNTFRKVLVWDVAPGGAVRLLRNGTVTVRDATGIAPEDAGTGPALQTLVSDTQGAVTFTHPTMTTVDLVSPNGFVDRVTSETSIAENAAVAEAAAQRAVDAAASVSPVAFDTDGVPYLTDTATDLIAMDTDGVPYIAL